MKTVFACLAILLLGATASSGDAQIAKKITDLNTLLQSATQRYDSNTISKLITDDYILVNGGGQVWDRDAFLKDIVDRSAVWMANDPSEVSVRSYNGDCAILIGLLHIKYSQNGKVHDLLARYTDVWVKNGGQWQYASGQASVYKRL